jgi:hypothetical protein
MRYVGVIAKSLFLKVGRWEICNLSNKVKTVGVVIAPPSPPDTLSTILGAVAKSLMDPKQQTVAVEHQLEKTTFIGMTRVRVATYISLRLQSIIRGVSKKKFIVLW